MATLIVEVVRTEQQRAVPLNARPRSERAPIRPGRKSSRSATSTRSPRAQTPRGKSASLRLLPIADPGVCLVDPKDVRAICAVGIG